MKFLMMQSIFGNNGLMFIVNVFPHGGDATHWIIGEKAFALMNGVVWTLNLFSDMANNAPHGLQCPQQNFFKRFV